MNIDSYLFDPKAHDAAYALPSCPHCGEEILDENACPDCDERECDYCEESTPKVDLIPADTEGDFLVCETCYDKLV